MSAQTEQPSTDNSVDPDFERFQRQREAKQEQERIAREQEQEREAREAARKAEEQAALEEQQRAAAAAAEEALKERERQRELERSSRDKVCTSFIISIFMLFVIFSNVKRYGFALVNSRRWRPMLT